MRVPWLKSIPLVSIVLVVLTYGSFGWGLAAASLEWSGQLQEQFAGWGWEMDTQIWVFVIHGIAAIAITLCAWTLTAPMTLMTYLVGNLVKSELRSIVSMVAWSFLLVVALRWFSYFTTLLVLVSAAILGRLELRATGLGKGLALLILTLVCVASFGSGAYGYFYVQGFGRGEF